MGAELYGLRTVRGIRAAQCLFCSLGRYGVRGLPAAGSPAPAPETVRLLGALLTGDWLTADGSDVPHRREAAGLVAAYLQWHLERVLKSLKHVERG